jgi:hypothetical protein
MRQLMPVAIAATAVSVFAYAVPVAAQASTARPSAEFTLSTHEVVSGARIWFSYSAKDAPEDAHVSLQLRDGGSGSWINVEALHAAGRAEISSLPAGVFIFRIRVAEGQRTLAVSAPDALAVASSVGNSGCSVACQVLEGVGAGITTWLLQTGAAWIVALF